MDALLGRAAPDALSLAVLGYLLLPVLLFTGGFVWWPFALPALAAGLAAAALSPGWRAGWPVGPRAAMACLLGGLAWAFGATGTHHLLYSAVDWQIRDAVLHDLASEGWPVAYAVGDLSWLLRAPVAYYLPAALAGTAWAGTALWAWTGLGLGLVLALLATLAAEAGLGRRGTLVVWLVFVVFGGGDLLPNLWLDGVEGPGVGAIIGRGGEWWTGEFQYSGHVTLLLWAPNHALPGWLPVLLLVRHGRRRDYAGSAGLGLAAAAAWGPVSAAGAAVLVVATILAQGRAGIVAALRGRPNRLALVLALPSILYLTAGSSGISHGWLVALRGWDALGTAALFLAVEVLPVWLPLLALVRWRMLWPALGLLAVLPLYIFGPGNEMAMRGAIAPLALLALAAGLALRRAPPGGWRRALMAALLLGAAGQATEASILIHPPWRPSAGCTLPEAAAQSVFEESTDWSHYVVPWPETLLLRLLAPPSVRAVDPRNLARCWPEVGSGAGRAAGRDAPGNW
jgi:hypothetical protein